MKRLMIGCVLFALVCVPPVYGQTSTPTVTPTSTPTPCDLVELEAVSGPPRIPPLSTLGSQDAIVLPHTVAAGSTLPLLLRFSHSTCISPGGDRYGEVCTSDEECLTLGVLVPYSCARRLRAPESIEYEVVRDEDNAVVASDQPTPGTITRIEVPGTATDVVGNAVAADTRQDRRMLLRWTYPCGESRRDIRFRVRQVYAPTPTPTPTNTATPTETGTPTP